MKSRLTAENRDCVLNLLNERDEIATAIASKKEEAVCLAAVLGVEAATVQRSRETEAAAAAARNAFVGQARTRYEKRAAVQQQRERRASAFGSGYDGMHAEEEDDGADVEQEEKEEKSEEVCGEDDGVAAAESKGECGGSSPRQGQKRSVEEVDEDMLVSVPPVQQQHNDENMAFTWTNTCTRTWSYLV
uniref:Uncharacterized protein n=1 Tax=Phytophthora fragariae TaxID=53985 RepID=A0A6A3FQE3_9STRA|nr:hypothetical protein PF009_g3748 [Phytophthora fragariae]